VVNAARRTKVSPIKVVLLGELIAILAAVLLGLVSQPVQAQSANQECNVNFQSVFVCVDKTVRPNPATVDQPIIFTIRVTAIQPSGSLGYFAGIRDTLPPGLIPVSAETSGGFQTPLPCTISNNTVDCNVPVNEDHPGTVTIEAIPTQCGDFSNSAFETEEGPTSTAHFTVTGCDEDFTPPKVISTFPRNGGEVDPAANIRATFSEDMREASVINAFKLFKKGSTNQIDAQVRYDATSDIATLNPDNSLRRGVTYKAVVTTAAKDVAGNRLDQDGSTSGLQQKVWFFKVDD
jgi:hypothetical protein